MYGRKQEWPVEACFETAYRHYLKGLKTEKTSKTCHDSQRVAGNRTGCVQNASQTHYLSDACNAGKGEENREHFL
jgi:hypothetical protein